MRVKLTGNRNDWHPRHEKYCKTKFACAEGNCSGRPKKNQFHITVCKNHLQENKMREADFINSLDMSLLPPGIQQSGISFLLLGNPLSMLNKTGGDKSACGPNFVQRDGQRYELLPDVEDNAVFMMQSLPAESSKDKTLLAFYDTGCSGAGVSDRGCSLLKTTVVRAGPTVLDVAGGRSLEIPYGDEQLTLKLAGGKQLATITALHTTNITSVFPLIKLQEAWEELLQEAKKSNKNIKLPSVDKEVGGVSVDLLIGIRYLKYYPILTFCLPSGLAVYTAQLQSASGNQAVLGGPHSA
jgi:hypothetical protein